MSAYLRITRAAFREQWRRHGLSAAIGTALLGGLAAWAGGPIHVEPLIAVALVGLVTAIVPAAAAVGVSRWVGRGPLGLSGSSGRDASTVASYGLGTALWAAPFGVAGLVSLVWSTPLDGIAMAFLALASLLPSAAGIGAAAGRLVQKAGPAILTAWGMVAATVALEIGAATLIDHWVPYAWSPVFAVGSLLALPMLVASGAVWISGKTRRAPLALGA